MSPKPHRLSIFAQPLDRAALLAYFLGGIVPLVALVWVGRRYGGAAVLELKLGGLIVALALLSFASFLLLQRTTRLALSKAERDNKRLANLVQFSRSLAQTGETDEAIRVATRAATALTDAESTYLVSLDRDGMNFTVLQSVGREAARTYAKNEDQVHELAALALPEDPNQQVTEVILGEIGSRNASAVGIGSPGGLEGALVMVRRPETVHDPEESGSLTTLARLITVSISKCELQASQNNFFTHVTNLLVSTLDSHLDYQTEHSRRVAHLANRIGRAMKMSDRKLHSLHFAALLHDIGMLRIDKDALRINRQAAESHAVIGYEMLKEIQLWHKIAPLVRHHHERWDGTGYPDQLIGDKIPIESRIIGVAEAYDSMTSAQSYRSPLPHSEAMLQIRHGARTQFDPEIVRIFQVLAESGELATVTG